MNRLAVLVCFCALFIGAIFDSADAARRAALVIGINSYGEVVDLEKAIGDAEAMARKLRQLGFEVTEILDADRRTLNQSISIFSATLSEGDTAFVHFSGHGVEIDGENYLLPADVPKPASGHKSFIKSEAIAMSSLVARIAEGGARTRVFVIDACRNNPFEQAGVRAIGSTRGLSRVEAPAGTFIMYSAGYRQRALDRLGEDDHEKTSVYTRTLLKHLGLPGKSIAGVAQDVRGEVEQLAMKIGHKQRPAYYDELSARLVLVEPHTADKLEPALPVAGTLSMLDEAAGAWSAIDGTSSAGVLNAFASRYSGTVYADFATARLNEIAQGRSQGGTAEQAAQNLTVAALPPTQVEPEPLIDPVELARSIQNELDRLGCDPGEPDGLWGRKSEGAVNQFNKHANLKLASALPSMGMLKKLETYRGRVCPVTCGRRYNAVGGECILKTCSRGETLAGSGTCVNQTVTRDDVLEWINNDKVSRLPSAAANLELAKKTAIEKCVNRVLMRASDTWSGSPPISRVTKNCENKLQ